MTEFQRLLPGEPVPSLRVGTVGGPCWRLCDQKPKNFTLVMFYRGFHCDYCMRQIREIEEKYDLFAARGVRVLAVSSDSRDRAETAAQAWGIDKLTLCWGLSMDQAREWGLYISEGGGHATSDFQEPLFFVEPAVFLVRPDGRLFAGAVQTMPFARPRIDDILEGIDYVLKNAVQPRGASDDIARAQAAE